MLKFLISRSASLLPQAAIGHLGWMRGAIGGGLAILASGLVALVLLGTNSAALPVLVAPLGASAVLVFAVPASPLAQPRSVIGGNLLSAAIGLTLGHAIGQPVLAAGLAVGIAIAAMSVTRCLHPPGGACALLCALGAAGPEAWGWAYLLPIAINVLALSAGGWCYNNLTGHPWPHHAVVPTAPPTGAGLAYSHEDLEAVLADWNEVLDVDIDDLDAIYQALHRRVTSR
ncbi:HPP family protein [Croceicoccus bisphenolivorans]|uniref:HPP family protein n=1 Tax=Croceicoccus bisphenolivorans TaxID=1783232 RepID=UPI00082B80C0|nr:HPP family protein [Croceicoccus bisphenolivorans]